MVETRAEMLVVWTNVVRRGEKGCGRQSPYHTYADELNMGCEKESKE